LSTIKTIYILSIVVLFSSLFAQDIDYSFASQAKGAPDYLADGFAYTFKEPQSQIMLGGSAVLAYSALKYDDRVEQYFVDNAILSPFLAKFGDIYGKYGAPLILISSVLIDAEMNNVPNIERSEKLEYALLGYTANAIATYGLKFLFRRPRPDRSNKLSFPSGHTSSSFVTAGIINELYGDVPGVLAYLVSTVVAISRMQDEHHYLSDVIFGAGLGLAISQGFAKVYDETHHKNKKESPAFEIRLVIPL
jgi:hypothetical protein